MRLWRLAPAERRVFLRAVPLVAAVRLCLWIVPFGTLHKNWSSILARLARPTVRGGIRPERIVWLVAQASRCVPGSHCLPRALVAQLLLARSGYLAELQIGVRKAGDSLDAHAWLEHEGVPLFERDPHLNGFIPFAATISSARSKPRAP